jgi:hypothetical protein
VKDPTPSPRGASATGRPRPAGRQHRQQRPRSVACGTVPGARCRAIKRVLSLPGPPVIDRGVLAEPLEPPCTDPYARWCGRGRRATAAPMPINGSSVHSTRSRPTGTSRCGPPPDSRDGLETGERAFIRTIINRSAARCAARRWTYVSWASGCEHGFAFPEYILKPGETYKCKKYTVYVSANFLKALALR